MTISLSTLNLLCCALFALMAAGLFLGPRAENDPSLWARWGREAHTLTYVAIAWILASAAATTLTCSPEVVRTMATATVARMEQGGPSVLLGSVALCVWMLLNSAAMVFSLGVACGYSRYLTRSRRKQRKMAHPQ